MTNKQAYQNALDSQNASNASGLIHSLAEALEPIWEEARSKGEGTDYVNTHPIMVLFLEQLVHLSGQNLCHARYSAAYKACVKGAQITEVTCPQCEGEDIYCRYCDGSRKVTENSAKEWHRQNP